MRVSAGKLIVGLVLVLVAMQAIVPARTNPSSDPAVALRAVMPSASAAAAVMERSCRDCHSNNTVWPWYSRVAPMSWLVVHDVNEGRGELNISEFGTYDARKRQHKLDEACDQVKNGEMPLASYLWLHPEAKLQPGDVEAICGLATPAD